MGKVKTPAHETPFIKHFLERKAAGEFKSSHEMLIAMMPALDVLFDADGYYVELGKHMAEKKEQDDEQ